MTMKQDALVYCEAHDCTFMDGEYCTVSEYTGEACEYSAAQRPAPVWPRTVAVVAAEAMGVGETMMRELVARREVPTVTAGRRVLVPVKALQDWIEQRRQER